MSGWPHPRRPERFHVLYFRERKGWVMSLRRDGSPYVGLWTHARRQAMRMTKQKRARGVLPDDIRIVKEGSVIDSVSYNEAQAD